MQARQPGFPSVRPPDRGAAGCFTVPVPSAPRQLGRAFGGNQRRYSNVLFSETVPGGEHMQKLVTIYLDNTAYGSPKVTGCYADKHALVEEHLQEYLTKGWQVRSL